jgi:ABC-type polysaccharide/polyol phosphate transport system ATPase subunit
VHEPIGGAVNRGHRSPSQQQILVLPSARELDAHLLDRATQHTHLGRRSSRQEQRSVAIGTQRSVANLRWADQGSKSLQLVGRLGFRRHGTQSYDRIGAGHGVDRPLCPRAPNQRRPLPTDSVSAMSAAPAHRDPIVSVSHLSKRFRLFHDRNQSLKQSLLNLRRSSYEDFWALRNINFDVVTGETFGIIGHNGSGKSTLLKCLTKILEPDEGSVSVKGSVSALLELGAGFHPELSGRENVFLNAAILGVSRKQVHERFDDIVEFSGLQQFIDTPVKNYSSGMFVRLGFAVAINVDPDVLIIDEVLAVGDADFQAKCGDRIADFRDRGKTIILVTHSMPDVVRLCQRAAWIDHGELRMLGSPIDITDAYLDTTHEGRSVQYQDGLRWGTGEVQIDSVELLGADMKPVAVARSGEPHAIRVDLTAEQPIAAPEVVLTIFDQNATLITEVSTRTREAVIDQVHGNRSVLFELDALPLNEGTYEMTCKVIDQSGQREFDVRSRFVRFDVLKGSTSDKGLITLGGHWDLG